MIMINKHIYLKDRFILLEDGLDKLSLVCSKAAKYFDRQTLNVSSSWLGVRQSSLASLLI